VIYVLLSVVTGVYRINILLIEPVSHEAECFAETLIVDDLSLAQEADCVIDVRVVGKPQDVIVGFAGFLFCCYNVRMTI